MAELTTTEQTLAGKIAKFLFTLLSYLGITSVTEVLQAIQAQATTFDFTTKPKLGDVGDTLLDTLATGGQLIPNANEQTTFEKWVGIVKGGWDAIEGGAGTVISFFDALIAGHKAKVAAEKAQETK